MTNVSENDWLKGMLERGEIKIQFPVMPPSFDWKPKIVVKLEIPCQRR